MSRSIYLLLFTFCSTYSSSTPEERLFMLITKQEAKNISPLKAVARFLEKHPQLDKAAKTIMGNTVVHYAVAGTPRPPFLRFLLGENFPTDEKNIAGITPLIDLLIWWDAQKAFFDKYPEDIATSIKILLLYGAKPPDGAFPRAQQGLQHFFYQVLFEGDQEIIELLVAQGVPIPQTAVITAYIQKHQVLAQWLVEHGAPLNNLNRRGASILTIAALSEDEDFVHFLLAHGADPNKSSLREPLMLLLAKNYSARPLNQKQVSIIYNLLIHGMQIPADEAYQEIIEKLLSIFTPLERDALDNTLTYLIDQEYEDYSTTTYSRHNSVFATPEEELRSALTLAAGQQHAASTRRTLELQKILIHWRTKQLLTIPQEDKKLIEPQYAQAFINNIRYSEHDIR